MTKYRINVKGAPAHLQEKWSKLLTEKFNRFMEERTKLDQAKERLRLARRKDLVNQIFPKSNDN